MKESSYRQRDELVQINKLTECPKNDTVRAYMKMNEKLKEGMEAIMATRARIGIKQKSGRIIASYQHWDGYPGGLGYNLCENWENSKKVTDAIKLGDSVASGE